MVPEPLFRPLAKEPMTVSLPESGKEAGCTAKPRRYGPTTSSTSAALRRTSAQELYGNYNVSRVLARTNDKGVIMRGRCQNREGSLEYNSKKLLVLRAGNTVANQDTAANQDTVNRPRKELPGMLFIFFGNHDEETAETREILATENEELIRSAQLNETQFAPTSELRQTSEPTAVKWQRCCVELQENRRDVRGYSQKQISSLWISSHNPSISLVPQFEWFDVDQYWRAFVEKQQFYPNHLCSAVKNPDGKEYDAKNEAGCMTAKASVDVTEAATRSQSGEPHGFGGGLSAMECHGGLYLSGTFWVQRTQRPQVRHPGVKQAPRRLCTNASRGEGGAARHDAPRRVHGRPKTDIHCHRWSRARNSSIETKLRESWDSHEETLNSEQNKEAAMNETNAQIKQDLIDNETKVASDKNSLATDEDVAVAGAAASGVVPVGSRCGYYRPGNTQQQQQQKQWDAWNITRRGRGHHRAYDMSVWEK